MAVGVKGSAKLNRYLSAGRWSTSVANVGTRVGTCMPANYYGETSTKAPQYPPSFGGAPTTCTRAHARPHARTDGRTHASLVVWYIIEHEVTGRSRNANTVAVTGSGGFANPSVCPSRAVPDFSAGAAPDRTIV